MEKNRSLDALSKSEFDSYRGDLEKHVNDLFTNMSLKVENMVADSVMRGKEEQRVTELALGATSNNWSQREQKILDVIDQQGKDIAVDFAKMEQAIQDMQTSVSH